MSGYLSVGRRGATARWKSTDVKPHLDSCSRARILMSCRESSKVELTLNDTIKHEMAISGADYLRELYIEAPVSSIRMRVLSGEVVCHGASLEGGRGVIVDNLSIRGNSGHTIFGSSVATNKQIDKQLGYDLIVLEYGLNAMQPGQRNFSKYKQKLGDMIQYCKRCFPDAAILVLGVSDRAIKGEGGWKSINSVTYLGPVQRDAAKINGACFWDLGKVVMSYGGVAGFVKNGWAAGDHIHINFKGGARIAESLVQAVQARAYEMLLKREGRSEDIACPIDLEPWKHFTEGVTEEDLSIPRVLLSGGEEVVNTTEVVAIEAPKVEEQKPEEVKEEPKKEEPKKEEPKKEEPKKEEPKKEELKVEEPKAESPKSDAKSAEDFVAEEPKAEPQKSEPQSAVAPTENVVAEPQNAEPQSIEPSKNDAPAVETPADVPVVEAPKAEAPKSEEPSVEAPKAEVSNPETKVE